MFLDKLYDNPFLSDLLLTSGAGILGGQGFGNAIQSGFQLAQRRDEQRQQSNARKREIELRQKQLKSEADRQARIDKLNENVKNRTRKLAEDKFVVDQRESDTAELKRSKEREKAYGIARKFIEQAGVNEVQKEQAFALADTGDLKSLNALISNHRKNKNKRDPIADYRTKKRIDQEFKEPKSPKLTRNERAITPLQYEDRVARRVRDRLSDITVATPADRIAARRAVERELSTQFGIQHPGPDTLAYLPSKAPPVPSAGTSPPSSGLVGGTGDLSPQGAPEPQPLAVQIQVGLQQALLAKGATQEQIMQVMSDPQLVEEINRDAAAWSAAGGQVNLEETIASYLEMMGL